MNLSVPERRVITYGHFDGLTDADMHFLRRAAALGDRLIIGLASDAEGPVKHDFDARRSALEACRCVDQVIAGAELDQMHTDIVNYDVALVVLPAAMAGVCDHLNELAHVLYLPDEPAPIAPAATSPMALSA